MRCFIIKDQGNTIREKQVYSGNDSSADGLIASFLAIHLGWTSEEVDQAAFDSSSVVIDQVPLRDAALTILDSGDGNSKAQRGAILVIIDEFNILRQRFNDLATDVSNATSLADLKTRWAVHPSLADRTFGQVKPSIKNKINAGTAD